MGEHVEENEFRIIEITVQDQAGSMSNFIRRLNGVLIQLRNFFLKTNHNYRQFNYIGEWHSHPLFSLNPSPTDYKTMLDIIENPDVGANFVILMLVKLVDGFVEPRIWSLVAGDRFIEAEIIILGATYGNVSKQ